MGALPEEEFFVISVMVTEGESCKGPNAIGATRFDLGFIYIICGCLRFF